MSEKYLEILTLAIDGMNFSQIAPIFNLTRERIRQIVFRYGFTAMSWEMMRNRKRKVHQSICQSCGKAKYFTGKSSSKGKYFCSSQCFGDFTHKNMTANPQSPRIHHPSRHYSSPRYKSININGKTTYLHRHVMSQYLGRKLKTREYVVHIDGNVANNNIDNLAIMDAKEHQSLISQREYAACKTLKPEVKSAMIELKHLVPPSFDI